LGKDAIIIGAGPAGLTAAIELLERTDLRPVILEASDAIGGLSQTVKHLGNRMDIGGHRFFSKSDRVMEWWLRFLPLQALEAEAQALRFQGMERVLSKGGAGPDPSQEERVMLLRPRLSRIYYARKFFPYPLQLNLKTLLDLGVWKSIKIACSYLKASIFPPHPVRTLEDFFVSRFGRELYQTFFKSYTEKVWGVPCTHLSAEWGAQRVKSLSITRAVLHSLGRIVPWLGRRRVETSLIEQFLYPKLGPGQLWECVAEEVQRRGGLILHDRRVIHLEHDGQRVLRVRATDRQAQVQEFEGAQVFSTMPIRELVRAMSPSPPDEVLGISEGLVYRDFLTVGLLVDRLETADRRVEDNWIYLHEPGIEAGRLQIFNNWSPWLVRDPSKVWIGLEYFCNEGDRLWAQSDEAMTRQALNELKQIGLIKEAVARESVVVRMPKAYPTYTGTYGRFPQLRAWLDGFNNLFLIGRNGMHRYNNQDHSMLVAMTAVDNLVAGVRGRDNLWAVNAEEDYHEAKSRDTGREAAE
jgi:protoporphyrinogen oxidase